MSTALRTVDLAQTLTPTVPGKPVWVQVGTLLDGLGHPPLKNAHLVYDEKAIRYVGVADLPPPESLVGDAKAPAAQLPEYTVLPGLVEAHAHLFLDGAPVDFEVRKAYLKKPTDWMMARARERLHRLISLGITAVRDAGDNRGINLALRQAYLTREEADPKLAYIDSAGAAFNREGRYGSFYACPVEDCPSLEACVAKRAQDGADRIKLIATGIINFKKAAVTAAPQLSIPEVAALTKAARQLKMPTLAHASGEEGIENVIEGGIDSVEHGFFITTSQLARMRDRGIVWVPTFAPVQIQIDRAKELGWSQEIVDGLRQIIDGHIQRLNIAVQLGVRLAAGSDAGSCGVPHGIGLLTEMELMERAGMSPQSVIAAATGWSAAHLKLKERVGRVAPGTRSRMIFTRHSPLETVKNLANGKLVVFDGEVFESGDRESEEGL